MARPRKKGALRYRLTPGGAAPAFAAHGKILVRLTAIGIKARSASGVTPAAGRARGRGFRPSVPHQPMDKEKHQAADRDAAPEDESHKPALRNRSPREAQPGRYGDRDGEAERPGGPWKPRAGGESGGITAASPARPAPRHLRALRELQGADIGRDGPAVLRLDAGRIGIHHAVAVRDHIEEMLRRRGPQAGRVVGRRAWESRAPRSCHRPGRRARGRACRRSRIAPARGAGARA